MMVTKRVVWIMIIRRTCYHDDDDHDGKPRYHNDDHYHDNKTWWHDADHRDNKTCHHNGNHHDNNTCHHDDGNDDDKYECICVSVMMCILCRELK